MAPRTCACIVLTQIRHDHLQGRTPSQRLPPTVGQNVLDVPYRRFILHLWDLGGSLSMRSLWDQYLPDAHVLVWVIDAPRWLSNAMVPDEAMPTYRAAVTESLCAVVTDAAARAQSVCVVVSQLDAVTPDRGSSLVQDVEAYLTAEWTRRLQETSLDSTMAPTWSFHGVSAATGYVVCTNAAMVWMPCWIRYWRALKRVLPEPAHSAVTLYPVCYSTKKK